MTLKTQEQFNEILSIQIYIIAFFEWHLITVLIGYALLLLR